MGDCYITMPTKIHYFQKKSPPWHKTNEQYANNGSTQERKIPLRRAELTLYRTCFPDSFYASTNAGRLASEINSRQRRKTPWKRKQTERCAYTHLNTNSTVDSFKLLVSTSASKRFYLIIQQHDLTSRDNSMAARGPTMDSQLPV